MLDQNTLVGREFEEKGSRQAGTYQADRHAGSDQVGSIANMKVSVQIGFNPSKAAKLGKGRNAGK